MTGHDPNTSTQAQMAELAKKCEGGNLQIWRPDANTIYIHVERLTDEECRVIVSALTAGAQIDIVSPVSPTQAQRYAAARALYLQRNGKSDEWANISEGSRVPYLLDAQAALTAVAQVGLDEDFGPELVLKSKFDNAIDRCAQVAEETQEKSWKEGRLLNVAAAIRALKDRP